MYFHNQILGHILGRKHSKEAWDPYITWNKQLHVIQAVQQSGIDIGNMNFGKYWTILYHFSKSILFSGFTVVTILEKYMNKRCFQSNIVFRLKKKKFSSRLK